MNNKERIEACLEELTMEALKDCNKNGIETIAIAEKLNLRRNVVSHYLNILVTEDKAIKTNSRPVHFFHKMAKTKAQIELKKLESKKEKDQFKKLVGYNGSLKIAVEQCKSAVFYPQGMSMMLTGKSGVGKSYLANIVHKYAIDNKVIAENAPFVTLNCADYADNPELLSANLFGYKKGAFTGADKDNKGLLEAADGGYLFLDEVHRLSPEGQEKLFVFLDKGVYKRLGESNIERKAEVRFLFATTEDLDSFLGTFLRRIPLVVNIPSLADRPIEERILLLYNFFHNEAVKVDKNLKIHKNVVNYILSQNKSGNVGSLKNLVKIFCAYCYKNNINDEVINISMEGLGHLIEDNNNKIKDYYKQDYLLVNKENDFLYYEENDDKEIIINFKNQLNSISKLLFDFDKNKINSSDLKKELNVIMNKAINLIVYNDENLFTNDIIENLYLNSITGILKVIEESYGFKYYGNTAKIISKLLIFFNNFNIDFNDYFGKNLKKIEEIEKKKLSKAYIITEKIIKNIEHNIDYSLDAKIELFLTLYIFTLINEKSSNVNAIILAHGYSTASSIASVANQLLGEFIFDAFDMPVDMSVAEVTKKVKEYVSSIDRNKDFIILVDMGSLLSIDKELVDIIKGDIGIINNITTNIALEIAGKIVNGENIEAMIESVERNAKLECRFIKSKEKKKAIITTCISGMGTSVKIKDLLLRCIGDVENLEVIPYEYKNLANRGIEDEIFKNYDVKLIISTTALKINGVNTVLLENLIASEEDVIFDKVLKDIIEEDEIKKVKDDLVKMFSLQNLINQLTILNPNKIINEVESVITNMENSFDKKFSSELRMLLYIHISIMIERLILKQGLVSQKDEEDYIKSNKKIIDIIKKSFSVTVKEYNLELTIREIELIQGIIEARIGKIEI